MPWLKSDARNACDGDLSAELNPRELQWGAVNMGYKRSTVGVVLACLAIAGCTNFGAQQVPANQFDYNKAIARSMQEQMLLTSFGSTISKRRFFSRSVRL